MGGLRDAQGTERSNRRLATEHGNNIFESEALPSEDLQAVLKGTIDAVIDIDAINHAIDQEREDAALLEATRRRVHIVLSGIGEGQ
ncbi:MAG: hypothetical protein ACYSWU_15225 [Planctomycetota bacterium]